MIKRSDTTTQSRRLRRWLTLAATALASSGFDAAVPPVRAQDTAIPIVLTNVHEVITRGSNASPSNRYDARVRGVIIYVSPPTQRLYVQDGDEGIQLNLTRPVTNFRSGQAVEVEGKVEPGLPFPRLVGATAHVLGEAPMPGAKSTSAAGLANGHDAFRFVTVRGVVRDMVSDKGWSTLLVTDERLAFEVAVFPGGQRLPYDWLDAEIEVSGFSYPFYDIQGHITGFRFHAAGTNFVKILKPGVADRFGRPLLTIAEAARLPQQWQPRVKVAGTVIFHRPLFGLFIDDGTGVMGVELLSPLAAAADVEHLDHETQTRLEPGERVEVIGARHNYYSLAPILVHAEYRRVGNAPPVQPLQVSMRELKEGRHAGRLVTLEARLLDQREWSSVNTWYQQLVLRADDMIFQARCESERPADWNLKPGTFVRVTGVNDARGSEQRKHSTFELLLRSPADVVLVAEPPVWARPEIYRIALGAAGAGLLAGAWILLQRWQMQRLERRVADRTADLSSANERLQQEVAGRQRAEIEMHRALAQEKELGELKSRFVSMVSHEFRTPLGIITSSAEILDAYLDRLSPEERRENLHDITDATRHMSRMMEEVLLLGRVEAGKMTCRPGPLDLAIFGRRIVDEVTSATSGRCPIELVVAPGLREAQADEGLLRHIFTNLLNNASKYSPPGSPVEFRVAAHHHFAVFTVRDRGIGIPESDARLLFQAFHRGRNVGDTPGTGLGMTVVKRCVELHGGKVAFDTREGSGTTFVVALPLFGAGDGNGDGTTQFLRAALGGQALTVIS